MANRFTQLESLIRRDPGKRGVVSYERNGRLPAEGELAAAAQSLAKKNAVIAVVTGFCILTPDGVVAETDGPPGALLLAKTLLELGAEVALISDASGVPVLQCGCDFLKLPRNMVFEFPFEDGDPDSPARASNEPQHNTLSNHFVNDFFAGSFGRRLTHLIAIERVGPSHSAATIQQNDPTAAPGFSADNPPQVWNRCYNMRGVDITAHTAKTHLLFERAAEQEAVTSIGIGDGGNEIGMGNLAWSDVAAAVANGQGGRIACRVATDHLILAGMSNWGGYALAAAVASLRGRSEILRGQDGQIGRLIEHLVRETPCVDGVTKRREPTVDGLPLATYLQVAEAVFGE